MMRPLFVATAVGAGLAFFVVVHRHQAAAVPAAHEAAQSGAGAMAWLPVVLTALVLVGMAVFVAVVAKRTGQRVQPLRRVPEPVGRSWHCRLYARGAVRWRVIGEGRIRTPRAPKGYVERVVISRWVGERGLPDGGLRCRAEQLPER
jgi:hypothetical protein